MLTVGITGRSGSGKSRVAARCAALGHPVADGDRLARLVTAPGSRGLAALAGAFGPGVLNADGALNRAALGALAFSSPQNNAKLMAITHPLIHEELLRAARKAEEAGAPLFFIDAAMIVGSPTQSRCQKLVVVFAEQALALRRIAARDGITREAAAARLAAQPAQEVLLAAADYVIENNSTEEELIRRTDGVLAALLAE